MIDIQKLVGDLHNFVDTLEVELQEANDKCSDMLSISSVNGMTSEIDDKLSELHDLVSDYYVNKTKDAYDDFIARIGKTNLMLDYEE